jgi:hypothetical protein
MGDLTLSLAGSITGAALCATALWVVGRQAAVGRVGRPVAIDPVDDDRVSVAQTR